MKLPLRLTGSLILKGLDVGLTLAIRFNHWLDDRKARKRGLSYQDVAHIKDQSDRGARARAPTVVIRK